MRIMPILPAVFLVLALVNVPSAEAVCFAGFGNTCSNGGNTFNKFIGNLFGGATSQPASSTGQTNDQIFKDLISGDFGAGSSYTYTGSTTGVDFGSSIDVKVLESFNVNLRENDVSWFDVDVVSVKPECVTCRNDFETAGFAYQYRVELFNFGNTNAPSVGFKLCVDEPSGKYCSEVNKLNLPPARYVFYVTFRQKELGVVTEFGTGKTFSEGVLLQGAEDRNFDVEVSADISGDDAIKDLGIKDILSTRRECTSRKTDIGTRTFCQNVPFIDTKFICPSGTQIDRDDSSLCTDFKDGAAQDSITETFKFPKITSKLASDLGLQIFSD